MSELGPSFMKISTCRRSPWSRSRNARTQIKNVNGASRASNFWNFFVRRNKNPLVKLLASIFWDQYGILLIDYLPKGQTINAEYYSSLMVQLKDILKEKRCGKVTKGVLFLHDNAPAQWALANRKKLTYLGFQCLDHPHYSPDLAPSKYHLFPGLKKTTERS